MSRSVLEQAASPSTSSDSSPVLVAAPERQRSRSLPVETEEDESNGGETDEVEEIKEEKMGTTVKKRLLTDLDVARLPLCAKAHEDANSVSSSSTSRYALRTRHDRPKRFDESIYNDVFMNSHGTYNEPTSAASTTMSNKKRRRRGGWGQNRRAKRLRSHADEDKGENDEDEDDEDDNEDGDDDGDKQMEQEMSIREINKKIEAQEREEQEKSRVLLRRGRPLHYSLRSRDSLSMSEGSVVSPPQTEKRSRQTKRSQREVSLSDDDQSEAGCEGEDDENVQSDNDDANSEDDREEDDGEEEPAGSTRYHLRQRRQAPTGNSMTTRSRSKVSSVPVFGTEDRSRRYSLRDRSKTHGTDVNEDVTASLETPAYAEYLKRRAGHATRRSSTNESGINRRLLLPDMDSSSPPHRHRGRGRRKHDQRHRKRHRRSFSSSSGSSSSSDMHTDDDDSDGGMRTSSPWRPSKSGRKSGNSRADIVPVEVDRSITWESVGGLKSHIESLKEMVMLPLLYPEFYDKFNVAPPSGVLFYGPPGTGKTLLARALANSCSSYDKDEQGRGSERAASHVQHGKKKERRGQHVTFYMRKGADCLSKWVGEAERQLRLLFEEAKRNQPSIIFFDEIDGLAPVRSAKQDQIHASIVSTLLALMDGMDSRGRVVVIGATNRLDAIDPALRRPGRFDRELGFKLPSVTERKSMLAIHSKHWNPPLSDKFLTELAEQTLGYCGADIKALCAEAALCSLRRVYPQVYASEDKLLINLDKVVVARGDFTKAAKKITPASHRTVSSFASPLPRAVERLLQQQLSKVVRDVSRNFPLFPLQKTSIDDVIVTGNDTDEDVGARDDEDEGEDDVDIYGMVNHDDCAVCRGNEAELLCCDACPKAFHPACLVDVTVAHKKSKSSEGFWLCPDCLGSDCTVQQRAHHVQKKRVHSIANLMLPRHSGFPRVLIAGKAGMGQQYIGPALLHLLEGLTHFSLDHPSLVADSNSHCPEEALIRRLTEAQKCLPCVLYLPQIELWWKNTSESMHLTLKMMLTNLQAQASLPIMFLACTASTSCEGQSLPEELLALFQEDPSVSATSVVMELCTPSKSERYAHFEQIFTSLATPPCLQKSERASHLEVLPLAPLPPARPEMKMTLEEQQRRKERDLHFLRELRIFLSQVLVYCYSQKAYTPFFVPVDPVAVPNYYLIVKRPMDLSTIRDKLNDEEYTCFEQFMDDIQLIVRNANVFNPKRSTTRHIAHAAGTMKDNILSYAHRFRIRQGYDLFAKCREVTKRLRAHPTMYGEYGQRFLDSTGKSSRTNHACASEKPGVRASARLRGVKAPDLGSNEVTSRATVSTDRPAIYEVAAKQEPSADVQGDTKIITRVAQWFNDEEEERKKKSGAGDCIKTGSGNKAAAEVEEDREEEVFEEGDRIFVSSRTYPGVNREGGAGVVVSCNKDGTYNVKYILGRREKSVSVKYIKRLTDTAVMESVKTQRYVASKTTDAAGSVRLIQDEEKMDETDYFDELLWPILREEGWKRVDNFDIIEASGEESGLAVQRVVFTPGTKQNGESVALNGVLEALEYVSADVDLSHKCFGYRYAEGLTAAEAPGESSSDEGIAEIDKAPVMETKAAAVESKVDEPVYEAQDDEQVKDEQKIPDFIYDEARMAAVLTKLVKKTANWTVDKLRDELLVLNKLVYPFRTRFDRTKLMMLLEAHEVAMQS
uniref:ATPase n=1 Tax=Hyaloperonospora arabidopsidis (strain Emoy2) TaxID=559515 RepID=M4BW77_HYAAE